MAFAQENAPVVEAPGTAATPTPASTPAAETDAASTPSQSTPAPVKRRTRRIATPTPTPVRVATPVPKRRGFWSRVFGRKKPTPAPATPPPVRQRATPRPTSSGGKPKTSVTKPAPSISTPAPAKPIKKTVAPEPAETLKKPTPVDTEEATSENAEPPAGKARNGKRGAASQRAANDTKPANTSKTPEAKNSTPPPDGKDPEAVEKWKYDEAKSKALNDPKLQELKNKADNAGDDDEARKALRNYNKALFGRMREVDPSIKDRADRMEAAVMRRLGGE